MNFQLLVKQTVTSCTPVLAPEGTAARKRPSLVTTSTCNIISNEEEELVSKFSAPLRAVQAALQCRNTIEIRKSCFNQCMLQSCVSDAQLAPEFKWYAMALYAAYLYCWVAS
jgi:hypothetical protein